MRRKRIIKLTAWMNGAIVVLSIYSALATEHVWFSVAAMFYSVLWLMAFMWANLPTEKPAGGAASISKNAVQMFVQSHTNKHSTGGAV